MTDLPRLILAHAEPTPEMDAAASKMPYQKVSRPNDPPVPLWVWLADADFDITIIRAGYRAMLAAQPPLTEEELEGLALKAFATHLGISSNSNDAKIQWEKWTGEPTKERWRNVIRALEE